MYAEVLIGSSGLNPLMTYILVFSIIAKSSGSSEAHFIVHTSRLWNEFEASESVDPFTTLSSEISKSVSTPVESMTANLLDKK